MPPTPPKATPHLRLSKCAEAASTQALFETSDELNTSEVTFKAHEGETYGPKLDTQETQDPTIVTLPQHFVPDTEQDSSCWPSADSAGDIGLHGFREAGPSDSQPGYITIVRKRSVECQYEKVGYIKTVSAATKSDDINVPSPETEEPKTPSSGKKSVKSCPKILKRKK